MMQEMEPRLLLVDDEAGILEELAEGLEALGLPARTADTAMAALDQVRANPGLQVVVTDLNLPRIDGIELLQKLNALRSSRSLAFIVMTGNASLDRAVAALRLNAVDFLQKPVSADEVALAVRRALAMIQDRKSEVRGGAGEAGRPDYLRALVAARADRASIFKTTLFSDPAWDMLLDLALAEAAGRPISVTSLCIASGVSTTTALRRIDDLQNSGLVERAADPADGRRILVHLTAAGRDRMQHFVRRQADRLGLQEVDVPVARRAAHS